MRVKVIAWCCVCVLVAACGARVPSTLRQQAADAAVGAGGSGPTVAAGPTAVGVTGNASAPVTLGSGSNTTPGAVITTPAAADANGLAPPAPAGGNGGATDIGVTAESILAGNVADVTGPVPGIFEGAVLGTKAYFTYINSQGGVFGRQLNLAAADGQADCNAAQSAAQGLAGKVFAFVGSFEIYDDCESTVLAQHPAIPDVSYPLSVQHKKLQSNFSVAPSPPGYPTGMFEYFKNKYGAATKNVGVLYSNVPAATYSYRMITAAAVAAGWKITYTRGFAATETNFTTDVVRMRQQGVQMFWSTFLTANQAATVVQEEQSQSWHPINILPNAYASNFLQLIGSNQAAEGIVGWNLYSLFFSPNDAANIREVALFQQWMQRTSPGTPLDLYAMYGWANAALYVNALRHVGPRVTRAAVMSYLRGLTNYDSGGIVSSASPGTKSQSPCYVIWVIHNGQYVRMDTPAAGYRCDGSYFSYTGS